MNIYSCFRRLAQVPIRLGILAGLGFSSLASAQVSYTGGTYTQNFDGLASTGTANPFVSNETVPGWFVANGDGGYSGAGVFSFAFPSTPTSTAQYRASTGSQTNGALYSFGADPAIADRALGSIPSNALNEFYTALAMTNNTGGSIANVTLNYVGEQWRRAGQGTFAQRPESLTFFYRVGGSALDGNGSWIAVPEADFVSPSATVNTDSLLDGNLAENRVAISRTIPLTLPAGEKIWFLWVDGNNSGNDHGLAIDDVSISLQSAVSGFPVVSSALTASITANSVFSYSILASNSPTSYAATPLPSGLVVNTATGVISGTPTTPGSYSITISATNSFGSGQATLTLTVDIDPNAPVVSPGQTISSILGTAITPYQLIASNSPVSYSSGALPAGLVLDAATGIISGTPTVAGTFTVAITATNTSGAGVANLSIAVNSAPIVTSELSASAYVNQPFTYTLVVDEQVDYPTSGVVWSGLPDGVARTTAKVITGTPTTPGTYVIGIAVSNDLNGTSTTNVTLTLTIIDQATQDAIPVSVVVNEFVNGTPDRVELLVIGDGTPGSTADLRGMILKDFSGSLVSDNGGKYVFASNSLWSAVPAGTLIVLSNGTSQTEELVVSDFVLSVNLGNSTYFTSVGTFDIANAEMVMIKAAGYGTLGVAGGIHALANGVSNPLPVDAGALKQYRDFTGKKLSATGSNATTPVVLANNSTSALVDFIGVASAYASLDATVSATSTLGAANNATNQTFIDSLRVTVVPPTLIEEWLIEYFGTSEDTTELLIGATEDFDGDGISNLLEYAFDTDPTEAGASPVVTARDGNFLTLSFPVIADEALTYTVLGSADLTLGFGATTGATVTAGGVSTYTDNVNLSTAGVRRFLRVEVTYTE